MIDKKIGKKVIITVFITIVLTIFIAQIVFSYKTQTIEVNKKEYKIQDSVIYTEIWVENEISIDSVKTYNDPFNDVNINMILTNGNKTYNIPGFWDGNNNWKIRFVCTEIGEWSYKIKSSDEKNEKLNNIEGKIECTAYSGENKIYKYGFLKTNEEKKYIMYNDSTPFFYLGDTNWSLGEEPVEMVKKIVEKRREQGFTVIQTEPLGENFSIYNGIDKGDINGFKDLDQKFEIIANAGLVNANAEFFYPSNMEALIINFGGYNEDGTVSETAQNYIEKITRYWVARYGAFPVIWTLGQEIDKDFYASDNNRKNWIKNNPYKLVAYYINKYDAYKQPITAHQENHKSTNVKNSCFINEKEHKMWAAQWQPSITKNIDFSVPKEYWNSNKPSINYEAKYCYLWTKNFGARAQGWISYLNGFYGYGYGAQDIWSYKNTYSENTNSNDGVDTITSEEKKAATWEKALEYSSAYQVGYMKKFFEDIGEWESLIPRFDDQNYLVRDDGVYASIASNEENSKIVIYFYNFSNKSVGENPNALTTGTKTGNLYNLIANHDYKYVWFNPISGEYSNIKYITSDSNGHITIPTKEDTDIVFYLFDKNITIKGIEPGYEYVLTLDEYDKIKNSNNAVFENNNIKSCYANTIEKIDQYLKDFSNNNIERTQEIYDLEIELLKSIINEKNNNNIKISNEEYVSLLESLEENINNLKDLFETVEDNINNDKLEKSLDKLIEKYNSNLDIDLSIETTLIQKVKAEYEVKEQQKGYFEKKIIIDEIEIISNILENDIKNKADTEYKAISSTSNVDLSKFTNQDVTVSLKLPDDKVKITNNDGSGNVTFSQNGEFTYEMEIRGNAYTYKVSVNNIDKTSPKLEITSTGTSIKPTATDENLKELKVEKEGKNIPYNQGEEITTPGIYLITAIDQANNQTTSKEIVYGIFKNTNNQDVKYVPINANELKAKTLKENANFSIKDNNQELADDANVATGNKLIKDGQEYTLIVKGDITKNGQVGTLDLIALRKSIVGLTNLENEQALAADLDDDGKINVLDLINERKKMVGLE